MLDSRQLTAAQRFAATTLDLVAQTTRNTASGTTDAWGHANETWTTINASVACGMSDPSPMQMQKYATLIGSARAWKVSFPWGTDLKRDDRVIVLGQTLRVQVDISIGSYSTLTQVLATEINELVR